ncbi:hypothetical protein, partial [Bacillus mycoides]|uniref:hypothetical protein n=1 Tax=Bacillus mycoides TaxID=1405 RepID=UPI003F689C30
HTHQRLMFENVYSAYQLLHLFLILVLHKNKENLIKNPYLSSVYKAYPSISKKDLSTYISIGTIYDIKAVKNLAL